ncbi:MAG: metal ABC transporter substrate-binding protein [Rhizobiales bacterium]|nr:metal ABC transporter substrate-binding protein [Hyphomicrobiales bacterium]
MLKIASLGLVAGTISLLPLAMGTAFAQDKPLKVVASFSIIADFAKNVGGDRVELTTLVGPDGDAHVYEPKPADVVAVGSADVMLVNGLGFEGFLDRLVEASSTTATIVTLTEGATLLALASGDEHGHAEAEKARSEAEEPEDGETGGLAAFDPHAWQSVPNAQIYVKNIVAAFCKADEAGCDTYKANGTAYEAKLVALDKQVRDAIAAIPQDKRTIITSHDAFGYFADQYKISLLAPEGVSTDAEASAADVAKLVDQIRQDKASAIFMENITDPRLSEQLARETGLAIGGSLYSDALSAQDGPAATYIDLMKHNITTISSAISES